MATKQETVVGNLKSELIKILSNLDSIKDFPVPITELKKNDFYLVAKKTSQRFRYGAKLVSEPDSEVLKLEYEGDIDITHYNLIRNGEGFFMTKVVSGIEDIVTERVWLFKNIADVIAFNDINKAIDQTQKIRGIVS